MVPSKLRKKMKRIDLGKNDDRPWFFQTPWSDQKFWYLQNGDDKWKHTGKGMYK
jgi:hypothetical protein